MARRALEGSALERALQDLEAASASDLRLQWRAIRRDVPPPTLSARLMRLSLAWELQAAAAGERVDDRRRDWAAIEKRRAAGAGASDAVNGLRAAAAGAGTRLMKTWGGETHEVIVLETGALWQGRTYSSLSAVAKAMTGTPRNGPKFFGLREVAR